MEFEPINSDFPGREAALANIPRYIHNITPVMFYRTNDLIHSKRVQYHLQEAIPYITTIFPHFDVEQARTLALVHDDVEILTGDPQLHDKEQMSEEELYQLKLEEEASIPVLVEMYEPEVNGFNYTTLLNLAKSKSTLEAQFVSFFDKFDGAGEAWHEVFAGNPCFLRPSTGDNKWDGGYIRRLNAFPELYDRMEPFFTMFPEYLPSCVDLSDLVAEMKPHTPESLLEDSGYPPYERWKKTVLKHEGVEQLTTQVEFPQIK